MREYDELKKELNKMKKDDLNRVLKKKKLEYLKAKNLLKDVGKIILMITRI